MPFIKKLLIGILALNLCACLHISEKIENLPLRADKSQVLKTLGRPYKIKRKDGKDHWIYKFVIEGKHYTQTIILKEGMLYEKRGLKPFSLKFF